MHLKRFLLVLLSALLAAAVFPPLGLWPLALMAWVPLLTSVKGASSRSAFYLGLLHGMILYGLSLSWFWGIFSFAAISLWGILGLFTAIFTMTVAKAEKLSPSYIAILWTGIEYFRGEVFLLSFTWITPGTGLPPNFLSPIVGVYGVTFAIIFGSALVLKNWKPGIPFLGALALLVMLYPEGTDEGDPIKVGLVQNESGFPGDYAEQSKNLVDKVEVLVWPEYSLGVFTGSEAAVGKSLSDKTTLLIAGGTEIRDGLKRNTSFAFTGNGIIGRHVKNHPVHLFDDGIAGDTAEPVGTEFGKIGMPICFDCDHQDVLRKMTKGGAEVFFVPSMDAESWTARQHEQHGMLFRHRAAENGRWLAIASTSGVTQIIDSRGHVRARLPVMTEENLIGEVYRSSVSTIFQKAGWLFGPSAMIFAALILVRALKRAFLF